MTKKQITISLLTLVALVGSVFAGIHIAKAYPYRENGKYYIPKEFSKIQLPATLHLRGKEWDDVNAFDSSLESMWVYTYENAQPVSNQATEQLLMTHFKQLGFTVSNEQVIADPDIIQFDATNDRLNIMVRVGNECNRICRYTTPGAQATIMVELPVTKAHLEI